MKKIDAAARRSYKSRSEYIRELVVSELRKEQEFEELLSRTRKQARKMGIRNEQDVNRIIKEYRQEKYASKNSS